MPTALKPDSTLDSVCFPRTTLEPYGALTGSSLIMSAEQTKAAAAAAPESHGEAPPERPAPFPIAGIGASAGGLEAYTQLLRHVPPDPGIAFVLIQHLDPKHESNMVDLLASVSSLPVHFAASGLPAEANQVYVIPPNTTLTIAQGVFVLQPRTDSKTLHMPIDAFLRSLADDRGHDAIGVILSGTGSDGTLGLRAIKEKNGVTFAQDETARYLGMPRSAIAGDSVDFVLPPKEIARELVRIGQFLNGRHTQIEQAAPQDRDDLEKLFRMLRRTTGVDFTHYKPTTIKRRIERRLVVQKLDSLPEYIGFAQQNPEELQALYNDILIHVTGFFRDPEAFEALKTLVFPGLLPGRSADAPIRVWIPACSTGEEAYSLAICLLEYLGELASPVPIKLFATDISDRAIARARDGLYPESITEDVSTERLRRFFVKTEAGYQISKAVRELCVFARQDLTRDPPFSQQDLISCRNALIYLDPVLQKRVLSVFHYALKPAGILLLGSSETIGGLSDLFSTVTSAHKLYAKKLTPGRPLPDFALREPLTGTGGAVPLAAAGTRGDLEVQKEADRVLLARYAPAGVVVNDDLDIVQFRGKTGLYLEPAAGAASFNLLKMARQGLMVDLRILIDAARNANAPIRKEGVRVKTNDHYQGICVEVIPLAATAGGRPSFVVTFEPAPARARPELDEPNRKEPAAAADTPEKQELARLQQELNATKAHLQSTIEELESSNEELKAANEEVMASNEELQSTNEELQTAKEELQATNEELTTVNDELASRNVSATQLNNDLTNLLTSVQIPIVMVGADLRIRRFTPSAARVFHLIPSDVGRVIDDIKPRIVIPKLEPLILNVGDTLVTRELEVQDEEGRWYVLSIRPYRTLDNKIDGAVIMVQDIDALKRGERTTREARDFAESIVDTVREPLVVLDGGLHVKTANRSFYQTFQIRPAETESGTFFELGKGQWNIPQLRTMLETVGENNSQLQDVQVDHEFPGLGRRSLLLNGRRIARDGPQGPLILLAIEDVTVRVEAEWALRESEARFRAIVVAAGEGILTMDEKGTVESFNRAAEQMYGYAAEEMIGKSFAVLLGEKATRKLGGPAVFLKAVAQAEESGLSLETVGKRKDGMEFPLQLVVTTVPGPRQLFAGLIRDLAALKEAQQRALQAERLAAIGQVSAGLAHESRNALQRGQASLELLRREVQQVPTAGRLLAQLQQAQDDLLNLYEEVREYASPMPLHRKPCPLDTVVREAWEQLATRHAGRQVQLNEERGTTDLTCEVDPDHLKQVFRNILENALIACSDPVRIDIAWNTTSLEGRPALAIALRNNGPPFTAEERRRIFDAFFTTRTHGTGMGMAIAKRIIEAHGGRMEVGETKQAAEILITLPREAS